MVVKYSHQRIEKTKIMLLALNLDINYQNSLHSVRTGLDPIACIF